MPSLGQLLSSEPLRTPFMQTEGQYIFGTLNLFVMGLTCQDRRAQVDTWNVFVRVSDTIKELVILLANKSWIVLRWFFFGLQIRDKTLSKNKPFSLN